MSVDTMLFSIRVFFALCVARVAADLATGMYSASKLLDKLDQRWEKVASDGLIMTAKAVGQQGLWMDIIVLTDTDISELVENWDVKLCWLSCDQTNLHRLVADINPLGDYINILIHCPSRATKPYLRQLFTNHAGRRRFNALITGIHSNVFVQEATVQEGENVLLLKQEEDAVRSGAISVSGCLVCGCSYNETKYIEVSRPGQIFEYPIKLMPATFEQFHGRELTVIYTQYTPFLMRQSGQFTGIDVEIIQVLANKFNFSYKWARPTSRGYGALDENGLWTGMVGDLVKGKGQIIAGGITAVYLRELVVDFLHPHHQESSIFMFQANYDRAHFLVSPFDQTVFICLLFVLLATACFHVIAWYTVALGKPEVRSYREHTQLITGEFLNSFGVLLLQGSYEYKGVSSKIVFTCYTFVGFLLVGAYCGNLVATLAVPKAQLPFQTVRELVDRDDYTVMIRKDSSNMLLLQQSTTKLKQEMWQKILKQDSKSLSPVTSSKIFPNIFDGKVVFFQDKTVLEINALRSNRCDISRLKEEWFPSNLALAVQEGAPYKRHFDHVLMQIRQYGLSQLWWARYYPRKGECALGGSRQTTPSHKITLQDLTFLWYGVAVMLSVSLGCLIGEWLVYFSFKTPEKPTLRLVGVIVSADNNMNGQ